MSCNAAFVDSDVFRELFLRHAGMMTDRKDVALMTRSNTVFFQFVLTVDTFASADHIGVSHNRLLSFKLVANATVSQATILTYTRKKVKGILSFY
jgi:hypothetical protein